MANRMASPSDSMIGMLLSSIMNPRTEQRGLPPNQRVMEPPPKPNLPFDQSQQPTLGSIAPRNRPPIPPMENMPRLPSQLVSPSNELINKLLEQLMLSSMNRSRGTQPPSRITGVRG